MTIGEFIETLISDDTTDIEVITNSAIDDFVDTQQKELIGEEKIEGE